MDMPRTILTIKKAISGLEMAFFCKLAVRTGV